MTRRYRTLHTYNLIWAVCHLFPRQRWRTHTYSVSGNNWPGEPRDLHKTTSARKKKLSFFVSFKNITKIIIIIMSCRQHGYPWPSLATSPYYSSPLAGLQGYILCPHIAAVCKFELVVLLLLDHMWGSIGVHHLWARPCFPSSVMRV